MQTKKILVTGASGFIGGHICDYLHRLGYEVLGWGRRKIPPDWWNSDIFYQSVDLLSEIPRLSNIYTIVHVAGLADDRSSFNKLLDINVRGLNNLIRVIPEHCGFIFISSASVYPLDREVHKEQRRISPEDNISFYGKSKHLAEQLLQKESHRCTYNTILRPRAVYGPRDTTLLPRLTKLLKGNTIYFPGDGAATMSLTHVFNLCEAVQLSLEKKANGIFNIADNRTYVIKQVLLDVLTADTPLRWRSWPLSIFRRIADINKWLGLNLPINHQSLNYLNTSMSLDIALAQQKLGYEPNFELADYISSRDEQLSSGVISRSEIAAS